MYDTLIDRLYTALKELKTYRATIRRVSKEFSSTLAPIRRLPIDVLRSVFRETRSYFGRRRQSVFGLPTIKFMHDTLTLGQVCGSWRDIVVSSPELWSHINITFPRLRPGTPSPRNFQRLLKTILPHSGPLPLDMRFRSGDTSSDEAIEAFSLLLGQHHRWKSASLEFPLDLLKRLRASTGKLACLESLSVMTLHPTGRSRELSPWVLGDILIDAPNLRKVVLHELIERGPFALPSRLTHLAASFADIHNLHTHSLLEELHLKEAYDGQVPFLHRITLPKVRRLSVSSLKLLQHPRLPSLEDLAFDSYVTRNLFSDAPHVDADAAVVTLNDFIRSSHCSLASLATGTSIVNASNFIQETLPLLESLTSLAFQIGVVPEHVFYHTLMSSNLLPNLQYLIMRLPSFSMEDVYQDALSTMSTSGCRHLLSVRIEWPFGPDNKSRVAGILNTLESLRQPGIDVRAVEEESSSGISFGNFA
ncbi:hypothetical protein EV421DRAFT_913853 [Armillaria borealis]|uniref:F-box domain-containing protein n=1 Tax=Armillaria borealis TaxID=47425 RepID=A0AA39K139_9AGAR|nr:hypothetical protein EV421DRAFT_913853 [Armillaria borealis]